MEETGRFMDKLPVSRQVLLRGVLLLTVAILALILANAAASLYEVWQLKPGALIPSPWGTLLGVTRVTERAHLLSLLGVAFFAGASLACLVFLVERLVREGYGWARRQFRR